MPTPYNRSRQSLLTVVAGGPATYNGNATTPADEKGLIIINFSAVVGTPMVTFYLDTAPDEGWVTENLGAALGVASPVAPGTFSYPVGPGTQNNQFILGDTFRIHAVVTGVGATVSFTSEYLTGVKD
jgi:hypothetical protein